MGTEHTCVLTVAHGVYCWGALPSGLPTPTEIAGFGAPPVELASGGLHACTRSGAGAVECFGYDDRGQLGNGTISYATDLAPQRVAGLPPVAGLSLGFDFSGAVGRDARAYCWGANGNGELGSGERGFDHRPGVVATLPAFESGFE